MVQIVMFKIIEALAYVLKDSPEMLGKKFYQKLFFPSKLKISKFSFKDTRAMKMDVDQTTIVNSTRRVFRSNVSMFVAMCNVEETLSVKLTIIWVDVKYLNFFF